MSIGTRLKEARRDVGLSQLQAATQVNAQQSTIWRYEAGRKTPTTDMLERLATLYKKSVQWFSEESEDTDEAKVKVR